MQEHKSLQFAIISAFLFGISPPLAKILVGDIPPVALAGFLYLGAFIGLSLYSIFVPNKRSSPLERKDLPWLAGAILAGGIIAPISMMSGLTSVSGFSASLLLNLEGIATAIIAVFFFNESAGKRLWLALACMTVAAVFLTWDPSQDNSSIVGSLLVIFAMVCWGIDNNLTRNISSKDPVQIAKIKGLVAGMTSLSLAFLIGSAISFDITIIFAVLLGAFSYGISLVFFIKALEGLGSFRTVALFSLAPFIGAITSVVLLGDVVGLQMFPATGLMLIGLWLMTTEKPPLLRGTGHKQ